MRRDTFFLPATLVACAVLIYSCTDREKLGASRTDPHILVETASTIPQPGLWGWRLGR